MREPGGRQSVAGGKLPAARVIPSLDGLRALSVLAVLVGHTAVSAPQWFSPALAAALPALGPIGVRVFFGISGYLITTLLLEDAEKHGGIRLTRFYLRRVLRIFPPYYALLATLMLATAGGWLPSEGRWWPAWLYVSNIAPTHSWYTLHTWSLAVEEQFYLTWPLILAWLGRDRAVRVAVAVCFAAPFVRAVVALLSGSSLIAGFVGYDCLAIGCLLALRPPDVARYVAWADRHGRALAVIAAALVLVDLSLARLAAEAVASHSAMAQLVVVDSLQAVIAGLAIIWCVLHSSSVVGRFLNVRALRILGVGSYSVYLWQEVFFSPDHLTALTLPGALVATAVAAALSYFAVERPALALRRRLERGGIQVTSRPGHAIFNG